MKRMIRLATAVMAFLLLFSVVVLLRGGGMEKLSESEKFAPLFKDRFVQP